MNTHCRLQASPPHNMPPALALHLPNACTAHRPPACSSSHLLPLPLVVPTPRLRCICLASALPCPLALQYTVSNTPYVKPGDLPPDEANTDIANIAFFAFQMMFAVITAAIISGVAAQRMRVR